MDLEYYRDRIKFELTGDVLNSELDDSAYDKIIQMTLNEINRYYDATQLVEVTGGRCIDLKALEDDKGIKINTVSAIYRNKPNGVSTSDTRSDPMLISAWNMGNSFYKYGTGKWAYNYMAYNTANQLANTLSTDLDFKEDKLDRKLYVNFSSTAPATLVIEYIPRLNSVTEVIGDYWIDILTRMSLAYAKITLGRIRTRFTQSDALWTQDGETMLTEGREELSAIRDRLQTRANFSYPLD